MQKKIATIVGENLAKLRIQKKISQKELAKFLKCSQRAISFWESGNREIPYDKLLEICDFFKTEPNYFFKIEQIQNIPMNKIEERLKSFVTIDELNKLRYEMEEMKRNMPKQTIQGR